MRSKLFVPGSRTELFVKALSGPADGLSFDLEDAVREEKKAQARENLAQFLVSQEVLSSTKTMIVRVNPIETSHFLPDLEAVVCAGVDIINLPKPEQADDVRYAAQKIAEVERNKGMNVDGQSPVRLLINIESPKALRIAHELAGADSRVMGLQLGLGDLFEPYAIERRQVVAVQAAMFQIAMAAHEHGLKVYDGAFANVADRDGFRQEAILARSLGFHGKSCIHPSQVDAANEAFRPTDEEIEFSRQVVQAEAKAQEDSVGAFMVQGKMIDAPFVNRAKNILALAKQLGLV